MPGLRKIMISIPDSLLKEVDTIVSSEKRSRSELIREAMKLYIEHKKKRNLRDVMKKGYKEMSEINLKLAEMCFMADNEIEEQFEVKLAECE